MTQAEQHAAALPWGAVQQQAPAAGAAAQEEVEADLPAQLGLSQGSRLEVLWTLHVEDDEGAEGGAETEHNKWWGAALAHKTGETDGEGRHVYVLSYDPDADAGWEEREERRVTFLGPHTLYDLSEDAADELLWRREGEAWEPPAEALEAGAEGGAVSLQDIVARIDAAERRRGRTVDEDAAEALAELPPEQRGVVAAGFRGFADAISAELAKLTQQHGAGYVVTEADVRAATAAAMQAAMRGLS